MVMQILHWLSDAGNLAELLKWMVWATPAIIAVSALMIARTLTLGRKPALMTFLVLQVYIEVIGSMAWETATQDVIRLGSILAMLVARPLLLNEMGLQRMERRIKASWGGAIIAACAFHAAAHPWTLDYKISLFRADMRIASAAVAVWILVDWKLRPALESKRTHAESVRSQIIRTGGAAWLATEAVQGCFVRGSIGRLLLNPTTPSAGLLYCTPWRWSVYCIVTCAAVMASAVWLAVAINRTKPRKSQAAALAQRVSGRVVEMRKVAA